MPAKTIGVPVTARSDSAAPPRASPSSLVEHHAAHLRGVPGTRSATLTASWPVMLSSTSSVSSGAAAARRRSISCIISSSTCRRPAVSRMSVSHNRSRATLCAFEQDHHVGVAGFAARHRHRDLLAQDLQLVHRRRAVDVETHQQRFAPALAQRGRQLGAERRLARALQADHHDHAGRLPQEERRRRPAEQFGQFLVDHPDDLLVGGEALVDFFADQARFHARHEVLHDTEVHVRFQQRTPHLAHGVADVVLGELPPRTDGGENLLELLGETREHTPATAIAPSHQNRARTPASAWHPAGGPVFSRDDSEREGLDRASRLPGGRYRRSFARKLAKVPDPAGGGKSQNEGALGRPGAPDGVDGGGVVGGYRSRAGLDGHGGQAQVAQSRGAGQYRRSERDWRQAIGHESGLR